ncbi:YciI family protein [Chelativorans salis]|uniref:YciI family protein n=1 Tax=Chelativorans salis TaxID=2978478 RepID=A0ABT2LJH3_9HYPH|nr:YciI family protein [Chelativorans sp. EGI FJ00035]MCT7374752.1 YciI family protein [Chelativorans sp. EGI FJ00035]
MRYMMLMIPKGYESAGPELDLPPDAVDKMMKYNEDLRAAGILRELNGLHPPSAGARVSFATGEPVVTDGPYAEAKEVVGGYWIIDVPTLQDAIEWAKRCPGQPNETIEIRRIQEMEDYTEEVKAVVNKYPDVPLGEKG